VDEPGGGEGCPVPGARQESGVHGGCDERGEVEGGRIDGRAEWYLSDLKGAKAKMDEEDDRGGSWRLLASGCELRVRSDEVGEDD
jgi:hypothetical protein